MVHLPGFTVLSIDNYDEDTITQALINKIESIENENHAMQDDEELKQLRECLENQNIEEIKKIIKAF